MATLLVNRGKEVIVDALIAAFDFFAAWGSGGGTTLVTDTTLFTEETEPRSMMSEAKVTGSTTNDTLRLIGTITAVGNKSITNAGVFDAAVAGNMFVKGDFASIPLTSGQSIQFTWDIRFA